MVTAVAGLQNVKTLLALIDGAEQSLSPDARHSDGTYSRLQQYKLEARGIRDMLEVPSQPSYIDPCRDSGDAIDAEASTYSNAQERAFTALRSPSGPNSILQNAQGLSKDAQHRCPHACMHCQGPSRTGSQSPTPSLTTTLTASLDADWPHMKESKKI